MWTIINSVKSWELCNAYLLRLKVLSRWCSYQAYSICLNDWTYQRWKGNSVRRGRHLLLRRNRLLLSLFLSSNGMMSKPKTVGFHSSSQTCRKVFIVFPNIFHWDIANTSTCLSPGSSFWWKYRAPKTVSPGKKNQRSNTASYF